MIDKQILSDHILRSIGQRAASSCGQRKNAERTFRSLILLSGAMPLGDKLAPCWLARACCFGVGSFCSNTGLPARIFMAATITRGDGRRIKSVRLFAFRQPQSIDTILAHKKGRATILYDCRPPEVHTCVSG